MDQGGSEPKFQKERGEGRVDQLRENSQIKQHLKYIKNSLKSLLKRNNPIASWAKEFAEKKTQMAHICVKRCFSSLVTRDMKNYPPYWQKSISLTIPSVGKDTEQLELLGIYDRCKIGATTPIIILFRKTLAHVYQEMCTIKFTFLFVTGKNWKKSRPFNMEYYYSNEKQ